jgi:hypothetical protein
MRDPKNLIINFLNPKHYGSRSKRCWRWRCNRVVDAQRDQNIINQVVAALKTTGGTTTA